MQLYELKQKKKADKLRQAAYEKREKLEIIDDPTNQVPPGPAYPSDIQQQEQEQQPVTSLQPSMDPSVGGLREYLDASLSSDKIGSNAHMLYPDTTAADQDCLLQNAALFKSVCLTTEDPGEQTVKSSQAAYERQDELENFDESTNQVTVQAGLTYPYSVQQQVQGEQEQNQGPTLPPSVSYDPTNTDTTAADQECFWQGTENTTFVRLMTDASEANCAFFADGNQTDNIVAVHGPNSQMLLTTKPIGPATISSSENMHLLDFTANKPAGSEMQQRFTNSSTNMLLSSESWDFADILACIDAQNQASRKWCVGLAAKWVISLRRIIATRPLKKQKICPLLT